MEKMSTLLAFILTGLNAISLSSIVSLAFGDSNPNYSLTNVIILDIVTYIFVLSLLSSFCLTENECCECCCPSNKCCLCEKKEKKPQAAEGTDNKPQKKPDCCENFYDCVYDCCCVPIGACTRKIGKHGVRYFSVVVLTIAHAGIIALCFYNISGTNFNMDSSTVFIVIIAGVAFIGNIFGMVAPCFECFAKLRYKPIPNKGQNKDNKNNNNANNNENRQDNIDVIIVKDALNAALIENENKQNNDNGNENNNNNDGNKDKEGVFQKIENINNTINTVNKINNVVGGFNKVFGVNKDDSNNNSNNKKEE